MPNRYTPMQFTRLQSLLLAARFRERLHTEMSARFPTLTPREVESRVADLHGVDDARLGETVAAVLEERWPTLTVDEQLDLLEDGAVSGSAASDSERLETSGGALRTLGRFVETPVINLVLQEMVSAALRQLLGL